MDLAQMRFLSLAEAAAVFGKREPYMRDLIATGRGPKVTRIGGNGPLLIRSDHLADWLESCATKNPRRPVMKQRRRKAREPEDHAMA